MFSKIGELDVKNKLPTIKTVYLYISIIEFCVDVDIDRFVFQFFMAQKHKP